MQAHINPVAVVGNLKQLETAILDEYFQCSRSGIDGVLNEFFQGVDWSDYDLAGSDLVDNILR